MATDVTVDLVAPGPGAADAVKQVEAVFREVEAACTRFDPTSPLMLANRDPDRWHDAPPALVAALAAALAAHAATGGLFDPRVLDHLTAWGYDRTLPFAGDPVVLPASAAAAAPARGPWRPSVDETNGRVRLGRSRVDLGGIGKGLAVRWAVAALQGHAEAALLQAGGDDHALGAGPDGDGWLIRVEDPRDRAGTAEPLAVLRLVDEAVATSSVRLRRWRQGDREVHHLVDPRTGRPATTGLLAVTVVAEDAAWAEVWAKALFVAGPGRLRALCDEHGLAALWVHDDGVVGLSRAMAPSVVWRGPQS